MRKIALRKETVTTLDDEILAQVYGGVMAKANATSDTVGC